MMNWIKNFSRLNNADKFVAITFFQNLYLYNHVGTLYLQSRGLSLLQVSSIWSIVVGTIFLAEVPTGVIADRFGKKKSVVLALLLQFLGEFLYLFAQSYTAIVLIAILAGIGYSFLSGANEALVYDSLPETERELEMKKAMGKIGGVYQLAFFIAPLLGSLVISELVLDKYLLGIGLTALSVLVAFLLSLTLDEPPVQPEQRGQSSWQILKDGLAQIRGSRKVQWIAAVMVLTSTFSNSLVTFYQPYFVQSGITSPLAIGAALALGGLVAFWVQKNIHAIEHRLGRWGLMVLSVLPGVLYLLFAVAAHAYTLLPLFVLTYAFADARNPLMSAYQNEQIESKSRATVISLINMLVKVHVAVVGIGLGWLANASIPAAWVAIGTLIIGATLLLRVDKITLKG